MLVSDLLAYSLRIAGVLGVGQVALAQDLADAQTALTIMAAQWQRKRWLAYRQQDQPILATPGKATYTIGPSGDIPGIRPGAMETVYVRQLIGGSSMPSALHVDFPLSRIDSREEWSRIALKNLQSWPGSFFFDPTLPDATVYIWPIILQTFFELHFVTVQMIGALPAGTDLLSVVPPEAEEALAWNLAARLKINYNLPPNPDLNALAQATLGTLRSTNFTIQRLAMPRALGRDGRLKNPMGGFYPEIAAGIPYSVTGP